MALICPLNREGSLGSYSLLAGCLTRYVELSYLLMSL